MARIIIGSGHTGLTISPGLPLGVGLTLGIGLQSGSPGLVGSGGSGAGIAFNGNGSLKASTVQHGLSKATFAGNGALSALMIQHGLSKATFAGTGSQQANATTNSANFATFASSPIGTATTLSGGNLIATTTNISVDGYSGARCTRSHTSGKFYHEMRVTTAADLSFGSWTCGYGNASAAVQTNNSTIPNPGFDAGFSAILAESGWWINSVNSNNAALPVNAGDVIGFAIDLDSRLCWSRNITVNPAIWNISGDPVAETGGENVAAMTGGVFPMWWGYTQAPDGGGVSAATANFGASPYAAAAPSGYGNW